MHKTVEQIFKILLLKLFTNFLNQQQSCLGQEASSNET